MAGNVLVVDFRSDALSAYQCRGLLRTGSRVRLLLICLPHMSGETLRLMQAYGAICGKDVEIQTIEALNRPDGLDGDCQRDGARVRPRQAQWVSDFRDILRKWAKDVLVCYVWTDVVEGSESLEAAETYKQGFAVLKDAFIQRNITKRTPTRLRPALRPVKPACVTVIAPGVAKPVKPAETIFPSGFPPSLPVVSPRDAASTNAGADATPAARLRPYVPRRDRQMNGERQREAVLGQRQRPWPGSRPLLDAAVSAARFDSANRYATARGHISEKTPRTEVDTTKHLSLRVFFWNWEVVAPFLVAVPPATNEAGVRSTVVASPGDMRRNIDSESPSLMLDFHRRAIAAEDFAQLVLQATADPVMTDVDQRYIAAFNDRFAVLRKDKKSWADCGGFKATRDDLEAVAKRICAEDEQSCGTNNMGEKSFGAQGVVGGAELSEELNGEKSDFESSSNLFSLPMKFFRSVFNFQDDGSKQQCASLPKSDVPVAGPLRAALDVLVGTSDSSSPAPHVSAPTSPGLSPVLKEVAESARIQRILILEALETQKSVEYLGEQPKEVDLPSPCTAAFTVDAGCHGTKAGVDAVAPVVAEMTTASTQASADPVSESGFPARTAAMAATGYADEVPSIPPAEAGALWCENCTVGNGGEGVTTNSVGRGKRQSERHLRCPKFEVCAPPPVGGLSVEALPPVERRRPILRRVRRDIEQLPKRRRVNSTIEVGSLAEKTAAGVPFSRIHFWDQGKGFILAASERCERIVVRAANGVRRYFAAQMQCLLYLALIYFAECAVRGVWRGDNEDGTWLGCLVGGTHCGRVDAAWRRLGFGTFGGPHGAELNWAVRLACIVHVVASLLLVDQLGAVSPKRGVEENGIKKHIETDREAVAAEKAPRGELMKSCLRIRPGAVAGGAGAARRSRLPLPPRRARNLRGGATGVIA